MKTLILSLILVSGIAFGAIPAVPESESPNGNLYAVMDIDRDPTIDPEWKGDSYPRIEITDKATGKVGTSIEYFGSPGDQRPLREHVSLKWRSDSRAFSVTINDRFYSTTQVYSQKKDGTYVSVSFPNYEEMTGFAQPNSDHLRPRGRGTVTGWDKDDHLFYDLFASPLPTFTGSDPLVHRVILKIADGLMSTVRVEHESGEWQRGAWIQTKKQNKAEMATPRKPSD
jgi:hypothetical protein